MNSVIQVFPPKQSACFNWIKRTIKSKQVLFVLLLNRIRNYSPFIITRLTVEGRLSHFQTKSYWIRGLMKDHYKIWTVNTRFNFLLSHKGLLILTLRLVVRRGASEWVAHKTPLKTRKSSVDLWAYMSRVTRQ